MTARTRLLQLAERRVHLRAQASADRESLAAVIARGDGPAELLAAGRRLLDELRRHPEILAAGAALFVVLKPRRALSWLLKGWSAWRMYRNARRWWLRLSGSAAAPAAARH